MTYRQTKTISVIISKHYFVCICHCWFLAFVSYIQTLRQYRGRSDWISGVLWFAIPLNWTRSCPFSCTGLKINQSCQSRNWLSLLVCPLVESLCNNHSTRNEYMNNFLSMKLLTNVRVYFLSFSIWYDKFTLLEWASFETKDVLKPASVTGVEL